MRLPPPQETGPRSTASRPHPVIPGEAAAATLAAQSFPAATSGGDYRLRAAADAGCAELSSRSRPEVPTAATSGCGLRSSAAGDLRAALSERILVLDGAMGTMIQRSGLAFEGPADALVLSHPEAIADIHEAYLRAGADIVSTNSFNANAVSLSDFGLASQVYEINFAAARIARAKADEFTLRNPSKPRFVAGSMGPTNKTASIAANPDDPSAREISFAELAAAYREQARGLIDGGVDLLLVETVFDTLNAKAALFAIAGLAQELSGEPLAGSGRAGTPGNDAVAGLSVGELAGSGCAGMPENDAVAGLSVGKLAGSGCAGMPENDAVAGLCGNAPAELAEEFSGGLSGSPSCGLADGKNPRRVPPVMVSGTIAGASGRTLSGQTVEAFCASVGGNAGSPWAFPSPPMEVSSPSDPLPSAASHPELAAGSPWAFPPPPMEVSSPSDPLQSAASHPELAAGSPWVFPLSVGLNCAFGAEQMQPYLERLSSSAECLVSAHPNAGLPNLAGGYDETAAQFAAHCEEFMRRGLVNIVGGCCGTTPEHILLLARAAARYEPRKRPTAHHNTVLSGLETLRIGPPPDAEFTSVKIGERESLPGVSAHDADPAACTFVKIGERANVAGSARFARLIREGSLDEAIGVARAQIAAGAQLVDVCMDAPMIDAGGWMRRFLLAAAAEPDLARVPWMVDSSSFEVLESGLQCTQGKALANSISLKEGEDEFLRRASLVRRYGAAAVVMLFDENGQADTYERKVKVAHRAYNLLTVNGFTPEDIIFDPNVLTIATGIAEHDRYAVDFIEATRWIKQNLPHARVSAGVSNLSFAFRGNSAVREAMHAIFLHHAVAAGLDMAIVNVATALTVSGLDPSLRELVEDVVLARRPDATERLTEFAQTMAAPKTASTTAPAVAAETPELTVSQRVTNAFLSGDDSNIAADTLAALAALKDPMAVIDRVLMPAMTEVGRLFGEGRMFLSQVVKSARAMRRAVDALAPYIKERARTREESPKFLLATVKGDVHDIGKNIVGVVAACNGWEIVDLGVMVDPVRIADEAERNSVSIIGLSGLITPSLHEMIETVRELDRRGLRIPVLIGGATTSALHTAVRIAPEYGGLVVHSRDASDGAAILSRLQSADSQAFTASVRTEQECLRKSYEAADGGEKTTRFAQSAAPNEASVPASPSESATAIGSRAARNRRPERALSSATNDEGSQTIAPAAPERLSRTISELRAHIDWPMYLASWGVRRDTDEGRRLLADAEAMLDRFEREQVLDIQGVAGVFAARTEGDDIIVIGDSDREVRLPMLRARDTQLSVAQWVSGSVGHIGSVSHTGSVGLFAITAGVGLKEFTEKLRNEGDDYSAIVAKLLADRLTEAFAQTLPLAGLRLAFGYPAVPDHSLKREVFDLLNVREHTKMTLTESFMIVPGEALCGIVVDHPDAKFFKIGRLTQAQIDDYARRRGMPIEQVKRLIDNELR